MNLFSTVKNFFSSYERTVNKGARTGTKVAVNWLVFSGILIVWLLVGLPWLTIFYPTLIGYAPHISSIIIALIGGATVAYSTCEIRKTVENIKNVQRDNDSNV